eukprot:365987-Chlamydomonas_euryale.AAC.31
MRAAHRDKGGMFDMLHVLATHRRPRAFMRHVPNLSRDESPKERHARRAGIGLKHILASPSPDSSEELPTSKSLIYGDQHITQ